MHVDTTNLVSGTDQWQAGCALASWPSMKGKQESTQHTSTDCSASRRAGCSSSTKKQCGATYSVTKQCCRLGCVFSQSGAPGAKQVHFQLDKIMPKVVPDAY
jgi:hypothetical protein